MKKGLILALLMVAMVSFVIPAGAKAPIVYDLPDVIVGDGDTADTVETDYRVMRFLNAFSVADSTLVNWNNDDSYTTDLRKVFYTVIGTPGTTVSAFTSEGRVVPMTPDEWTALVDEMNPGSADNLIDPIAGGGYTASVSFIDDAMSPMEEADLSKDGALLTSLTAGVYAATDAAGYEKVTNLRFAFAMTSGTKVVANMDPALTSNRSWADVKVTCRGEAEDNADRITTLVDEDVSGTTPGDWYFNVDSASTAYKPATEYTVNGIGFTVVPDASLVGHAEWRRDGFLSGSDNVVYKFTATLASAAATSDDCPGFRLYYMNQALSHIGGVYFRHNATAVQYGGEELAPFTGTDKDIVVYWAVPTHMQGHGDGEILSATPGVTGDGRDYTLRFDLIADPGDSGNIVMKHVLIQSMARPARTDVKLAWGTPTANIVGATAGTGFSTPPGEWKKDDFAPGALAGFTALTPTITANTLQLSTNQPSGACYSRVTSGQIGSSTVTQANTLSLDANHTYRLTIEAKASAVASSPWHRCVITQQYPWDTTVGSFGAGGTKPMFWEEFWAKTQYEAFWYDSSWNWLAFGSDELKAMTGAPTGPNADETLYEMYIYSHDVAPRTTDPNTNTQAVLELSALSNGKWDSFTGWTDKSIITVNYVGWDDLGGDM
jgi:hypothetical protein